jgi:hypothetical protein
MAYFNHAFRKSFLATGVSVTNLDITLLDGTTATVDTDGGYLITAGVPSYSLNLISQASEAAPGGSPLTSGYIGYFNPNTNLSVVPDGGSNCCPLYLAGSAIYTNDKIGKFHGGYQETNKSKTINPRYVSRFYTVAPCEPNNEVVHVGSTFWTAGGGLTAIGGLVAGTGYANGTYTTTVTGGSGTGAVVEVVVTGGTIDSVTIINPGKGYANTDINIVIDGGNDDATFDVVSVTTANVDPVTGSGGAACCHEFLCGETYYLRLDVKGSPALRYLNHNAYYIAEAYTGCCPDGAIAPTPVDSTLVMIQWANAILRYPVVNPFVQIAVQDQTGVTWYAPGTPAAFLAANGADTWDNYVSPGYIDGACAGLIFNGAYVDTRFGDCTFQISDFYEKEPVRLYLSEVDLNGDPCTFDGLCVVHECLGRQVNGLGETVLRDMILSESYRQNFFHSDFRIREITQGNQIIASVDRGGLYWRYYLQHSIPRHNNPTGTFDSDQYLLEVYALNPIGGTNPLTDFVDSTTGWLDGCGVCEIDTVECVTNCEAILAFPVVL